MKTTTSVPRMIPNVGVPSLAEDLRNLAPICHPYYELKDITKHGNIANASCEYSPSSKPWQNREKAR
jgi:hypothetical protein